MRTVNALLHDRAPGSTRSPAWSFQPHRTRRGPRANDLEDPLDRAGGATPGALAHDFARIGVGAGARGAGPDPQAESEPAAPPATTEGSATAGGTTEGAATTGTGTTTGAVGATTGQQGAPGQTPGTPAQAGLRWEFIKRHQWDALWFFSGERPSGFSTTATLRAQGYSDPNRVEWFVRQGSDKVYAPGGYNGPELELHSSDGSVTAGDVHIEVQERMPDGTVASHLGQFTVRKPHHLIQQWSSDTSSCPPWDPSPAACPSLWSQISYRIVDNVGGTIVGATVNERFPGPQASDQPNMWTGAPVTSGSSWPNTNGTFVDNLYKCCGVPPPVGASSPNWGDKVYHEPHEFYVGSTVSGRGCRVQTHTLQFYRGFADHENITSPAP